MCLLIESIRLEDGIFHNVSFHQRRVEHAFRALFGASQPLDLQSLLEKSSRVPVKGRYKCRILYDDRSADVSFVAYTLKPVVTLKVVTDDDIAYAHKFSDRSALDNLYP